MIFPLTRIISRHCVYRTRHVDSSTFQQPDIARIENRNMCGITGFLGLTGDNTGTLGDMIAAIYSRGPDAQNQWIDEDQQIALGHARLSVVDLSEAGAQPMSNASGRYVVSYNGEIYNHLDIRKQLDANSQSSGWRGTSDTETLVAAFDHWGIEPTLQKCIGMFAIAIWDKSEATLTLAIDRFGEKPLYYQPTRKGVIFASELSSLKKHPECSTTVSQSAVMHLAEASCVPAPLSIYEGVYKLVPGTLITFSLAGFLSTQQWWSPIDTALQHYNTWEGSENEAVLELENRLSQCIERQMIADVPLGAFLSGGIDSSLITALMQQHSTKPVKTYTVGFNDHTFDEAQYARKVATHLGTEHTEHYVSDKEIIDLIPKVPEIYSEPFADSSQLPTFLVAQLARQEVTVVLSGDAGDEIFGGYNRHIFTHNNWGTISRVPTPLRKALASILQLPTESQLDKMFSLLPLTSNWTRIGEKIQRSAHSLSSGTLQELYSNLTRNEHSNHVLSPSDAAIQNTGPQSQLLASMQDTENSSAEVLDPLRWLMVKDQSDFLPNDVLVKVDRAAMACSLETRTPFLDHTLVEFSQSLPASMLIEKNNGKKLLRNILKKHIPSELFERPKMGFSIPVADMIKHPLRDWTEEHLSNSAIQNGGAFDAKVVRKLWEEHLSGKTNHIKLLWPVLMYQSWKEAA